MKRAWRLAVFGGINNSQLTGAVRIGLKPFGTANERQTEFVLKDFIKKDTAQVLEGDLLPAARRPTLLFSRLRSAAESAAGRPFTLAELAQFTGVPKSSLSRWLTGDGQPSVEAVLRLLELVPVAAQREILDAKGFLRVYPTLEHPRIACNLTVRSQLRTVLVAAHQN